MCEKKWRKKRAQTRAFVGKSPLYRESPSRDGQISVGNGTGYVSPPWECNTYLETPDVVHRLGQISKSMEYANRRGNGMRFASSRHLSSSNTREKSRGLSGKMATRQYRKKSRTFRRERTHWLMRNLIGIFWRSSINDFACFYEE